VETLWWRGAFADGYTDDDICRLNEAFESVSLVCVWGECASWGFTGDSQVYAIAPDGTAYEVSDEFWEYLTEDDPDAPSESFGGGESLAGPKLCDLDVDAMAGEGPNYARKQR